MCRNCSTRFCFKCLRILTDNVSCDCSIEEHGFVDPKTGRRVEHLARRKDIRTKPLLPARKPTSGGHLRGRGCVSSKKPVGKPRGARTGCK
jgi:hypothetical protein